MAVRIHKFARKPFYVDAVRVNETNMEEVAQWCGGQIKTTDEGKPYIKVRVYRPVSVRQGQAYIGDWVLSSGNGYKVYDPKSFDKHFEKVKTLTKEQADEAGIKVPHEPSQAPQAAVKVDKREMLVGAPIPRDPRLMVKTSEGDKPL